MIEGHEMYESSTVHLSVQGRHRLQEPPSILHTNGGGGGGTCDTDRQAREERVVEEALPLTLLLSLSVLLLFYGTISQDG